jgi:membrane-bound metal-dependent hydrolase YbcI (DUF457 family)
MTSGHFGLAAGVKKFAPLVPLWALFLSAYLLDVAFLVLWIFGAEDLTPIDPSHPNAYGGILIHADYTHSLVGAFLIALVAGWLASLRWGKRGGMAIAAVAFSHWILDLIVHRPDLLLGFGLWNKPVTSAIIELILVLGGIYFYSRATNSVKRDRRVMAANTVTGILLILLFVTNILGL